MTDPFASAPDEPQTAPAAPTAVAPPQAVAAVSGGGVEISMTFKQGAGFDSSWNVVRTGSVAEANAVLYDPEFKKLLDRQWEISDYCHKGGSTPSHAPASPGAAPAGAQGPPPGAPPAPGADWTFKSGVSASTGKPWKGWMPPRGSTEKPLFFN